MFAKVTPTPMLAVKDVARARRFYTDTMGLQSKEVMDGILEVKAGDEAFVVYPSEYAGTNKATAMTWVVGDQLEKTVEALKKKGVTQSLCATTPISCSTTITVFPASTSPDNCTTNRSTSAACNPVVGSSSTYSVSPRACRCSSVASLIR